MEGQRQPQIRTMARDLKRARFGNSSPETTPKPTPPLKPETKTGAKVPQIKGVEPKVETPRMGRKLSDILAEARIRVQEPASASEDLRRVSESPRDITPPSFAQRPSQKREDAAENDLLPIEPSGSRDTKPSYETEEGHPEFANGKLRSGQGPASLRVPANLPIGEPSLSVPEPEELPPMRIESQEEKAVPLSSKQPFPHEKQPEKIKKTPEEILGLHAKTQKKDDLLREIRSTPNKAPKIHTYEDKRKPSKKLPRPGISRIKSLPTSKFVVATIILSGIFLTAVYGIYWNFFVQKAPSPALPTQKINEQPLPEPLIKSNITKIIEVTNLEYNSLKPKLDALKKSNFPPGSLAYIAVKYASETEIRYLTLTEIFNVLQIDTPQILNDYKDFTLYIYSPDLEAKNLCAQANILDESCYGPRMGIVIKLSAAGEGILTQKTASSIMQEWEKTIIDDFLPLMLSTPQKPADYIAEQSFSVGEYMGFESHYINLPIHTTSLDWLLSDSRLIIATSKDAGSAAASNLK